MTNTLDYEVCWCAAMSNYIMPSYYNTDAAMLFHSLRHHMKLQRVTS